ncbi:MAG: OmpA family protein [Flavobacteriaceae bacterium]|nr:OmpA family protein [Flavobacteriaceae bacterium]
MRADIRLLAVLFFLCGAVITHAQEERSKADILFFEYAYQDAISEYLEEQRRSPLTVKQQQNLAQSYLKVGNYDKASEAYLQVFKQDSTMTDHQFNNMLQAMAKASGKERVKAFLDTKKHTLPKELIENADFNLVLLDKQDAENPGYKVFHANGNSNQSDFSPTFYKDRLLFTTARALESKPIYGPSGESFLDIWVARIGPDGNLANPNPFFGIPEAKFHEATPFYSKELDKVFYISSNVEKGKLKFSPSGKNTLGITMASDDRTSNYLLKDLNISFYYPFYDAESGKLYFAANFDDSLGGTDIYFVYTNNGLIMSAPINLGPRINTPGNEIAPYIYDGSLFYSSDIFYGLGGMDIYKSDIQQDGTFSIPVNLGTGINTEVDDFGLVIRSQDSGGVLGYFASNRQGGDGNDDLYGFTADKKPGLKTFALRGTVMNIADNDEVPGAQVRVLGGEGNVLTELSTANDGSFRFEIPWQEQLTVQATKEKFSVFSATYDAAEMEEIQGIGYNMGIVALDDLVERSDNKTLFKLRKFFFSSGRTDLTPEIQTELDKVVDAMSRFPGIKFSIAVHTDSRGGRTTNQRLSQARADAIKDYLIKNGVDRANILSATGYGESQLTNQCKDGVFCLEMLHKQNERYLFVIENYDEL